MLLLKLSAVSLCLTHILLYLPAFYAYVSTASRAITIAPYKSNTEGPHLRVRACGVYDLSVRQALFGGVKVIRECADLNLENFLGVSITDSVNRSFCVGCPIIVWHDVQTIPSVRH